MGRALVLLLLGFLLSGCSDSVIRNYCDWQLGPASLKVDVVEDPVVYQHYRSQYELARVLRENGVAVHGDAMGLTTASYSFMVDFSMRTVKGPGFACAKPRADVSLQLTHPVVDVASEADKNSCRYKEVLAHEEKHIRAYREHLNKTAAAVEAAFKRRYPEGKLFVEKDVDQVLKLHSSELQGWLQPFLSAELGKIKGLQAALDTPDEYERLSNACEDSSSPGFGH